MTATLTRYDGRADVAALRDEIYARLSTCEEGVATEAIAQALAMHLMAHCPQRLLGRAFGIAQQAILRCFAIGTLPAPGEEWKGGGDAD